MEPTTRRSLVLRLRDPRDEAAWAEFVDIYEPLVYRLASVHNLSLLGRVLADLRRTVLYTP